MAVPRRVEVDMESDWAIFCIWCHDSGLWGLSCQMVDLPLSMPGSARPYASRRCLGCRGMGFGHCLDCTMTGYRHIASRGTTEPLRLNKTSTHESACEADTFQGSLLQSNFAFFRLVALSARQCPSCGSRWLEYLSRLSVSTWIVQ